MKSLFSNEENSERKNLVSMDSSGVHIINEDVAKKLKNKKISASMITGLEGCHAQWAVNTFVLGEILEQEPDNPMTRGSMFHSVMEHFFALKPEERTKENLNAVVEQVLDMDDFKHFKLIPDAITWLKTAIRNYYEMGGNPEKTQVAIIEGKPALERFVKGNIGDTKRDILGFIDRISVDSRDQSKLVVEDWKTGGKAKHWKPNTTSTEGLPEQRQQMIYAMLLEKQGYEVSSARLIYPVAKDIVTVNLDDEEMKERVIQSVKDTDEKLDSLIESNDFKYEPSFLCHWCPLAKVCEAPRKTRQLKLRNKKDGSKSKLQIAYEGQPDIETLAKGIKFQ